MENYALIKATLSRIQDSFGKKDSNLEAPIAQPRHNREPVSLVLILKMNGIAEAIP